MALTISARITSASDQPRWWLRERVGFRSRFPIVSEVFFLSSPSAIFSACGCINIQWMHICSACSTHVPCNSLILLYLLFLERMERINI